MKPRRWGVLLDRDGTLVPDAAHPTRPEQLRLYAKVGAALRVLKESGAILAVVSNQSAVARGLLDAKGLARLDRRLRALVRGEGVSLDAAYYCPHHPDFTGPCRCRKPEPGMLRDAMRDLDLDPARTFLIGDGASDLEAGRRAGVRTVLVLTGHGKRTREAGGRTADRVAADLLAAARWVVSGREVRGERGAASGRRPARTKASAPRRGSRSGSRGGARPRRRGATPRSRRASG